MGKKVGLFSFVAGLAAGAATLFLSDDKNREKAEVELGKVAVKAKQLKKDFDKDPEGTVRAVAKNVEGKAKKIVRKVKLTKVVVKTAPAKRKAAKK